MNKQFEQVKQFHTACGIEMPDKPTILENDGHIMTLATFGQELNSLVNRMKQASRDGFGGEVLKRTSFMLEEICEFMTAPTIEDQADALADLQYFSIGTNTLMGVNPEPIFDIVAQANLGKIGPDGKVEYNEMGKIKKPVGWTESFAPEIKIRLEIERQSNPVKGFQGGD